ncbi:hypothetical protein SAMD00019534_101300 [Acytostelium subglobosum LB1]|uniref:hypothetical protein n=1 Tax=Acytostelium subglobosum LB1 TaxID=1410327 RepID=UPI000644B785|nr:hypothetical protein SAMD00019534_101300 [Acytostelium subglobosum LB1]GAM26955.1 hypothetical protein SAMD00019534_101300 [Acytostelium subglobosum LB1]|eukprot:XP_012750223.1 hypothetical protein SAMD00019534_101300 [Acytostelium subglobosum LB1]
MTTFFWQSDLGSTYSGRVFINIANANPNYRYTVTNIDPKAPIVARNMVAYTGTYYRIDFNINPGYNRSDHVNLSIKVNNLSQFSANITIPFQYPKTYTRTTKLLNLYPFPANNSQFVAGDDWTLASNSIISAIEVNSEVAIVNPHDQYLVSKFIPLLGSKDNGLYNLYFPITSGTYGVQEPYSIYTNDVNSTKGSTIVYGINGPKITPVINITAIQSTETDCFISHLNTTLNAIKPINIQLSGIIPFPYGYRSIPGSSNYNFTVSFPVPKYVQQYFTSVEIFHLYMYPEMKFAVWSPPVGAPPSPQIVEIQYLPFSTYSFILRVHIVGESFMKLLAYNAVITYSKLVSGTLADGWYEAECHTILPPATTTIGSASLYNQLSAIITYNYGSSLLNVNLDTLSAIPPGYKMNISVEDIVSYKFDPPTVDLSNATGRTDLLFKLRAPLMDMTAEPQVYIPSSTTFGTSIDFSSVYTGAYDPSIGMYRVPIDLKAKLFTRRVPYYLFGAKVLDDAFLAASPLIGNNAYLNVKSDYADEFGPVVVSMDVTNATAIIPATPTKNTTLGWLLRIEDKPSGFKNGYALITSKYDKRPMNISFTSFDALSGNEFSGQYKINFTVNGNCRSDTYQLDLILYDYLGNSATSIMNSLSLRDVTTPVTSPFIYVTRKTITITCQTPLDTTPPSLVSFDITNSVDLGSLDRRVIVNMVVKDNDGGSGISSNPRHSPMVYFSSIGMAITSLSMTLVSINGMQATYTCNSSLPYGFGTGSGVLTLSIYGITDNHYNVFGYNTINLLNLGLPYYINTTFNILQPVLVSHSPITTNGGRIIIRGYRMGFNDTTSNTIKCTINYGNGDQDITPSFISNPVFMFHLQPFDYNATLIISNNGIQSNLLVIIPYTPKPDPRPTVKPTTPPIYQCPGDCFGNGKCTENGCKCTPPWYGESCNSKTIIIPNPMDPANGPTTNNTIEDPSGIFTSMVSVVSLRELAPDGSMVTEYNFTKWTFTNNSQDNMAYQYSAPLGDGTQTTVVRVLVEYFESITNITFSGQEITMMPSSIKYTISLSPYVFDSVVNTLQLIMSASMESTNTSGCAASEIGYTDESSLNSLQWIKLKIGDKSLYGRFLAKGLIDGRIASITNRKLSESSLSSTKAFIFVGMSVPFFTQSVVLDPDFSMLLDQTGTGGSCGGGQPTGLSRSSLIAIIIAASVVVAAVIVAGLMYVFKRRKYDRENKSMEINMMQGSQS